MTDMVFGLPVLVLAVLLACAIGWLISYVRSQQIVTSQHVQLGKLETERDLLLDRITEHEQLRDKQGHEFNQIQLKHTELLRQHSALSTSLDEKQLHFTEQLRQLSDSREALKREFENLANEILERKGKAFKELNQESIYHLLKPVQTEMQSFRQKVESIHVEELKQRSELRAELINLQNLNRQITDQADKLTNALQGQKKSAG